MAGGNRGRGLATALVVLVALGIGSMVDDDDGAAGSSADGSSVQPKDEPEPQTTKRHSRKREARRSSTSEQAERSAREKPKRPQQRSYLVSRVIDGDTLELGNGQTVRLVGIDTPEVGECGYERAKHNLEGLALSKRVRLTVSDEDRDRYGRLLRYVDVGAKDAGLRLIQNGYAIARYDSRDGYGYHPREGTYIRADRAAKGLTCPKPAPVQAPRQLAGGGCAAGYRPCIPPYPPDLDCADVDGTVYVTGSDPHGLDADGDGIACEWG